MRPTPETQALESPAVTARLELVAWLVLSFRPPSLEQLETLSQNDPRLLLRDIGLLPEIGARLDLSWSNRPLPELLAELQEEHVRLFVASKSNPVAHLEALAYLTDRNDERTRFLVDLGAELSQLGLHPASNYGLPPDHLTLLLELLYARGVADRLPMDEAFQERYLRNWVPQFLDRLASARPATFYEDAARVLASVLTLDDPFLSASGSWIDGRQETQS